MAMTDPMLGVKTDGSKLQVSKDKVAAAEEKDKKGFGENWRQVRKDWLKDVPEWYDGWGLAPEDEAIDIATEAVTKQSGKWILQKLNKEGADIEDHTCGPALKIAKRANFILWMFFVLFPWTCGYLMSCPPIHEKGEGLELVGYPLWLWVPFLLLVYGLLRMEAVATKSSIVAQVITSGVPFGGKWKYNKFLYIMLIVSLIYHMDIFTNGVYMARVYKTEQCMDQSAKNHMLSIEEIWHETMVSSAAGKTFLAYIPYWAWAVVAWASLLLQPAYALCYSYPLSPELQPPKDKHDDVDVSHPERKEIDHKYRRSGTDCAQYHVRFRSDQQHGRALQAIAESARMNAIYFLDPDYMHHQVKTFQPGEVHREMQRCNIRFFIFIVETIFPPNLQASFLCMERALVGNSDYVIFVSVAISLITGLLYVKSELTTVFNFHRLVLSQKDKFDVWESENGASRELQFKSKAAVMHSWRSKIICIFLAVFGMYMLVQAVLKAYMGAFVCECGMWNNHGFPLAKGCVAYEVFKTAGFPNSCGRTAN